jgi:replicative DNA helicase
MPTTKRLHNEEAALNSFVFGAPPPSHPELEEVVLGAILNDSSAIQITVDVFADANPFYLSAHQAIYNAARALHENYKPVDILTVQAALKKAGQLERVGGPYFLVQLLDKVASSANTEYHARLIFQAHIQREIARVSAELIQAANDPMTDALELLEKAELSMQSFSSGLVQSNAQDARRIAGQVLKEAEAIRSGNKMPGLSTGFLDLDDYYQGLKPGEVYIVAGRPGMGKTAFVTSIARRIAEQGSRVGMFSLEMSKEQLIQRLISQFGAIDLQDVMNPKRMDRLRYEFYVDAVNRVSTLPILIDDAGGVSIAQAKAKARAMKREGIDVLIVDYIQLMSGSLAGERGNREQEISSISRGLKTLAKELNIPIIALSQLSRAVESRTDKRPQLSDLRESGSIEQDAYSVAFLYRPEYYNIMQDADGNDTRGACAVIVAKNRNGATGTLWMKFKADTVEFTDYSDKVIGIFPTHTTNDHEELGF